MRNYTSFWPRLMALLFIVLVSCPAITTGTEVAWFRMGEDDPGASAGLTGNDPTGDLVELNAARQGGPVYSTDTPGVLSPSGSSLSMKFDGVDDAYLYSGTSLQSTTDNFVVEAWIKPTEFTGAYVFIHGNNWDGVGLHLTGDGVFNAYISAVTGFAGSFTAELNEWQHVAIVRDGGIVTFYLNGVADPETATSFRGIDPFFDIGFADSRGTPYGYFTGLIDDVRLSTFEPGQFDPETDLYLKPSCKARLLYPRSGGTVNPDEDLLLRWFPDIQDCRALIGHQVYFGPKDPNDPDYLQDMGIVTDPEMLIPADNLDFSQSYAWRVDEVYEPLIVGGDPNILTGEVSTFTAVILPNFTTVAWYRMEGSDIGTLVDSAGGDDDMSLVGGGTPSYSTDVPTTNPPLEGNTQSVRFDRTDPNGGFQLNRALLTEEDGFVMEAYVKPAANSVLEMDWLLHQNSVMASIVMNGTGDNGMGIVASGNQFGFLLGGVSSVWSDFQLDSINWIHLAMVRGKYYNNGNVTLLINHEKVAEASSGPILPVSAGPASISGLSAEEWIYAWDGLIDEVRFSVFEGALNFDDLLPPAVWTDHCGQQGQVYNKMDFDQNCYVDLSDFAAFAATWLGCTDPVDQITCDRWNAP